MSGTIIYVPENTQVKYIYAPARSLSKKQTGTYSQDKQEKYISLKEIVSSAKILSQEKIVSIYLGVLSVRRSLGEVGSAEHSEADRRAVITFELAQHAQLELDLDLTNCPNNLELSFKFNLNGPGTSIKLISRAILRNQQEIKITTEQNHLASDTTSDLLLKTICFDQAKWSYNGKIFAGPAGHRTVASQINHNLLVASAVSATSLDKLRDEREKIYRGINPEAISIPALEVLTNDVKCTHGSAVGQVDRDSLYYLMARGLTAEQAETVLLESFLG